jgi:hypothetical protein
VYRHRVAKTDIRESLTHTPDAYGKSCRSSDVARLHADRQIFITSLGDPTVPASFTRQLPRNQEFAMVRFSDRQSAKCRMNAGNLTLRTIRQRPPL